jgi:hypothetical protein
LAHLSQTRVASSITSAMSNGGSMNADSQGTVSRLARITSGRKVRVAVGLNSSGPGSTTRLRGLGLCNACNRFPTADWCHGNGVG